MTFAEALVFVAAIAGLATVAVHVVQALWPRESEAALEQRSLSELALLRDEVSKLRADTSRDRDELRKAVTDQERAIVQTVTKVNDCLQETSKLSLHLSQVRK